VGACAQVSFEHDAKSVDEFVDHLLLQAARHLALVQRVLQPLPQAQEALAVRAGVIVAVDEDRRSGELPLDELDHAQQGLADGVDEFLRLSAAQAGYRISGGGTVGEQQCGQVLLAGQVIAPAGEEHRFQGLPITRRGVEILFDLRPYRTSGIFDRLGAVVAAHQHDVAVLAIQYPVQRNRQIVLGIPEPGIADGQNAREYAVPYEQGFIPYGAVDHVASSNPLMNVMRRGQMPPPQVHLSTLPVRSAMGKPGQGIAALLKALRGARCRRWLGNGVGKMRRQEHARAPRARRLWNNPQQRKDLALSSRGRKPCTNAVQ
jgi:hypothetical protein